MIDPEEIQRFTDECVLLRKIIQQGHKLAPLDHLILKSHLSMLLWDLEKNYGTPEPPEKTPARPKP
jgi:hypothetical protein